MTKAVDQLLGTFRTRFGKYPNVAQFDEGKEFYNVGVRELLESHNVHYFSTQSDKKAAIVERFNRTLKTKMEKYFYSKNYNNTEHKSIHMKPKDVNKTNENIVWVTLYGHVLEGLQPPKFKVGDTVRVSKYKSIFAKEYEANFTEEIFRVSKVLRGDPTVYEIQDHEGEPIIGKFYEQELSLINKKDDMYKIEKILRKKDGMALVKWLGYDSQSWVLKTFNKMSEEDFKKYETSYRQYFGPNYNKALRNLKSTKNVWNDNSLNNTRTLIWIGSGLTSSYKNRRRYRNERIVYSPRRAIFRHYGRRF